MAQWGESFSQYYNMQVVQLLDSNSLWNHSLQFTTSTISPILLLLLPPLLFSLFCFPHIAAILEREREREEVFENAPPKITKKIFHEGR